MVARVERVKPVESWRWRKGQPSPNPSGRPKLTPLQREALAMMKDDAPHNAAWMIAARNNLQVPWELRIRLAIHLDNRCHGEPAKLAAVAQISRPLRDITPDMDARDASELWAAMLAADDVPRGRIIDHGDDLNARLRAAISSEE